MIHIAKLQERASKVMLRVFQACSFPGIKVLIEKTHVSFQSQDFPYLITGDQDGHILVYHMAGHLCIKLQVSTFVNVIYTS